VQGQIAASIGGFCRSKPAGWRGGATPDAKSLLARGLALQAQGANRSGGGPPRMGFLGLVGCGRSQPRPDAGRTLEPLQAGRTCDPQRRQRAEAYARSRRRAWPWSQRQWPGSLFAQRSLEQLVALGASGGQVAMVGDGSTMPLPWPPPTRHRGWRRAPRSPQDPADLVILAIVSKPVGRGLALARDTMARCAQNLAWGSVTTW